MKLFKHVVLLHLLLISSCVSNSPQDISKKPTETEAVSPQRQTIDLNSFPKVECENNASSRQEVRARHIVIQTPINPKESDLSTAHEKAIKARAELVNGESFSAVESKYSVGASSRGVNGGDLGFFKKGVMVKEFEEMAFCLPANVISPVFSTDFGFHVIEVTEIK